MKKIIDNLKNFKMDKRTSAYTIMSFTVICLLITIFVATNGMKVSYSATGTATPTTPPASLTFNGTIPAGWTFGDSGLTLGYDFKATDGTNTYDMYCIEGQNSGIQSTSTYTWSEGNKIDSKYVSGLIWLLENAYPNNSTSAYMGFDTVNEKKFVTQYAIWYYLDYFGPFSYTDSASATHTTQLSTTQKSAIDDGDDKYVTAIKALANAAKAYNDTHSGDLTVGFTDDIQYSISGNYLQSNEISLSTNKPEFLKSFTVSVAGNEYDAQVVDKNGTAADSLTFTSGSDKFFIRIPLEKVQKSEKFTLNVSVTGSFKDSVYYYNETSGGQKPIIVTDATTAYQFNLNVPLVQITKTDITDGKAVSGASLSVTDTEGNVIASWVTDGNPHYVSLNPGKYILKETTSPDGYELNTETVPFEVKDDGIIVKVEMKNTPTTPVPNTAENIPTYIYLIGLMIVIIGGVVIYEAVKPQKNK